MLAGWWTLQLKVRAGPAHPGASSVVEGLQWDVIITVTAWIMASKDSQTRIFTTCGCHFSWQNGLCRCDWVQDLMVGRLSWIIWVDSKCIHKGPYNTLLRDTYISQRETQLQKRKSRVTTEAVGEKEGDPKILCCWLSRWRKEPGAKKCRWLLEPLIRSFLKLLGDFL